MGSLAKLVIFLIFLLFVFLVLIVLSLSLLFGCFMVASSMGLWPSGNREMTMMQPQLPTSFVFHCQITVWLQKKTFYGSLTAANYSLAVPHITDFLIAWFGNSASNMPLSLMRPFWHDQCRNFLTAAGSAVEFSQFSERSVLTQYWFDLIWPITFGSRIFLSPWNCEWIGNLAALWNGGVIRVNRWSVQTRTGVF